MWDDWANFWNTELPTLKVRLVGLVLGMLKLSNGNRLFSVWPLLASCAIRLIAKIHRPFHTGKVASHDLADPYDP